jgi:hypothetical protein
MPSDRFEYAKWQLAERGNPEPLRKELARLEKTSTGAQVVEAQQLLAAHDTPAGDTAAG